MVNAKRWYCHHKRTDTDRAKEKENEREREIDGKKRELEHSAIGKGRREGGGGHTGGLAAALEDVPDERTRAQQVVRIRRPTKLHANVR
jgi:hypothetical protein